MTTNTSIKIKRALLSVSDKTGIVELARFLCDHGVELISTGGTATELSKNGIQYTPIEKVTGNPESFGGRMKTISFQIGSALLFRRDHDQDIKEAQKLGIQPIDLVVCNLYPFEKTAADQKPFTDLIENIDIGGPTMIRAAAKNFQSVACITNPNEYSVLMREITMAGSVSLDSRKNWALQTFTLIAGYDLAIATELARHIPNQQSYALRYGENPHQRAVLLAINNSSSKQPLGTAKFIQGKELSYNNLLDADQAFKLASELNIQFPNHASVVIVKHGTPCGVALATNILAALELAWNADPVSAFGGIFAFSEPMTLPCAEFLKERFVEVLVAPDYEESAKQLLSKKKNLRVLQSSLKTATDREWVARSINGGILVQDEDFVSGLEIQSVTKNPLPSTSSFKNLASFGVIVTQYLKSNCIGLFQEQKCSDGSVGYVILSSGVGQPNRLDCITKLIAPRLKERGLTAANALLVSDAFFPFRDSIDAAHTLGVTCILQPGGSVRDPEVIEACNEYGIQMGLTGKRHFRH